MEEYIIASHSHLHDTFSIWIIGIIDDDKIFFWHMDKCVDDFIDTLFFCESRERNIVFRYFFCDHAFYIVVLLYRIGNLISYRTESEHIHWWIEDFYILSSCPFFEKFFIVERICHDFSDLPHLIEKEVFSHKESDHKKFMIKEGNTLHVFFSPIKKLMRETMRVVKSFYIFFDQMYRRRCFT